MTHVACVNTIYILGDVMSKLEYSNITGEVLDLDVAEDRLIVVDYVEYDHDSSGDDGDSSGDDGDSSGDDGDGSGDNGDDSSDGSNSDDDDGVESRVLFYQINQ